MPSSSFKIGLIQMSCSDDTDGNLAKVDKRVNELVQDGAKVICLQELFNNLYFCQHVEKSPFELAEKIDGKTFQFLSQLANQYQIYIIGSIFEKTDDHLFYNTAIVIDDTGQLMGTYRKKHIPDDAHNHYAEMNYFTPGDGDYPIFETKYGKIGVLVCWDQWFPEAARILSLQGAEIIFYPTAIGWPVGGRDSYNGKAEVNAWETIQRAHAISNTVFVASVNRVKIEDQLEFWGNSFVCDPMGVILQKASHDKEENLCVEINLNRIQEVRHDWPLLECRRIDTYQPLLSSPKK